MSLQQFIEGQQPVIVHLMRSEASDGNAKLCFFEGVPHLNDQAPLHQLKPRPDLFDLLPLDLEGALAIPV